MDDSEQLVAGVLTPPGRGAVAVIAVEGKLALAVVEKNFQAKSKGLAERALNSIAYGRWGAEPAEDVVVCRRNERLIEIHCHGGVAAVSRILGDLTAAGEATETWQASIARHEASAIRAAARVALAQAVTERTAMILLDQYHGALENAVESVLNDLGRNQLDAAKDQLDAILNYASLGLHLTQPWKVVIAGPPNVGKSSLINALLGYERAIVFDQPGTTRDVVTAHTALDGWPVQLADTAGLRASDDELESAGVERAIAQAAAAECLLLVFDASDTWVAENDRLIESWPRALVVHNKCDLIAPTVEGLRVSALTGAGIPELIQAIVERLVPAVPRPGKAVPFAAAQVDALRTASEHLRQHNASNAVVSLQKLLSGFCTSQCE
jgi:tRNA modification GTPase